LGKFRKSIFFKVALLIISLQTLVLFVIAVLLQKHQLRLIQKIHNQQHSFITTFIEHQKIKQISKEVDNIKSVVNVLSGTLAYSLYNLDEGNLKKIIKSLLKKRVIKSVYIYDSVGKEIFIGGYKDGKKIILTKNIPPQFMAYPSIKEDIVYNKEKLGYIKIFYDMAEILNELKAQETQALEIANMQMDNVYYSLQKEHKFLYIYFFLASLLVTLVVVWVLFSLVNKPLSELKKGLESFFKFLANPKNRVTPIHIDSQDEFGEIAKFANNGIVISSHLHAKLAELMEVVNRYVPIVEFDEKCKIINLTDAFCDVVGFSKEYLIGKDIGFLGIDCNELIKKIETNGVCQIEMKLFDNKWLFSTFTKKELADIKEYVWISYDITSKKEVEFMKNNLEVLVDEKSKEIQKLHNLTMDSIKYASLIQYAILPPKGLFDEAFEDYFIIWEPKDIVGGDIYLFEKISENEYILMVIDATGHGVAGAFVTMLIKAIERQIIYDFKINDSPGKILSEFNKNIKNILHQFEDKTSASNAGFDGGVIYINLKDNILKFAGANVGLYYVEDGEVNFIKGDRHSIGYRQSKMDYEFKEHILSLNKDAFYITTDGFIDQNGGKKGFPFGKKRFKELIKENYNKPFDIQKVIFENELKSYQSLEERNDDITVIGFKGKK